MIIDKLPRQIILGYQNEHNVNNIVIDCSAWLADYPSGLIAATMILPGSDNVVLLSSTITDGVLTIPVTRAMTAKAGIGSLNVRMTVGSDENEKRSALAETLTRESHKQNTGTIPDAMQDWLTDAGAKLAQLDGITDSLTLTFDKATCKLSISGGNTVELNRGLNEAQYTHLTDIMSRPYGTWTLTTGPVYSQTHPSRDVPGRKSCRVEWGLGIIHLDFVAALAEGIIGSIPATGPKAEILMEDQLHDGATIWIDQGSRAIKAQGLTVGSRYLFNIVGFFIK